MRDCLGKVSRLQIYLPASLASTPSMTRAQMVGFCRTTLNLESPENVTLSSVRRSIVERPWSTDQETVVDCFIQMLQWRATEDPMLALTRLLLTELASNLDSTVLAAARGRLGPIIGWLV